MTLKINSLRGLASLVLCVALGIPSSAEAKKFDVELDNSAVTAVIVEQPAPSFPDGKMRRGQEGWVRVSFVVNQDGKAIDPIVVDSTGGALFEQAALEAVDAWQFEPPAKGEECANNTVDVRFERSGDRDRATRNFLRRYRGIVHDLYYLNPEKARDQVDMANEFGGWNLYESTMLELLNARVEGVEGDNVEELEHYERAIAVANRTALDGKERVEVIGKILALQVESQHYGDALSTLEMLKAEPGSEKELAGLEDPIATLRSSVAGDDPIRAKATIHNPCNCDSGEPLWSYTPVRRSFSFAELDGNVERFEARCENHRISAAVEPDTQWSLPDAWGSCQVFVFGDDSATFDFIEHGEDKGDRDVGPSAVASTDVLDQ